MRKRPIGGLVKALNNIGAKISYIYEDGFPPVKIGKSKLSGGNIEMSFT